MEAKLTGLEPTAQNNEDCIESDLPNRGKKKGDLFKARGQRFDTGGKVAEIAGERTKVNFERNKSR